MTNSYYIQFYHWLRRKPGQNLLKKELVALSCFWKKISGDNIVVFGDPLLQSLVTTSRFKNHFVVSSDNKCLSSTNVVIADYESLPFASDSIDAVLLPHTLEFADDPYRILQQAEIDYPQHKAQLNSAAREGRLRHS